jgi:hypothetical protein
MVAPRDLAMQDYQRKLQKGDENPYDNQQADDAATGLLQSEDRKCRSGFCKKYQVPPAPLAMQRR